MRAAPAGNGDEVRADPEGKSSGTSALNTRSSDAEILLASRLRHQKARGRVAAREDQGLFRIRASLPRSGGQHEEILDAPAERRCKRQSG
jgi:hypothetical protein